MKEPKLRQWHGYLGILLSVFMILQAGSGLLISFGYMTFSYAHLLNSDFINLAHYGGDAAGHIYRIFLGIGIVVQVLTGGLIFMKIRQRQKLNRARISKAKLKTAASRNEHQD